MTPDLRAALRASTEAQARVKRENAARDYLRDLCDALNGAFISTWQSTAAWQKELDAANEFLASQGDTP